MHIFLVILACVLGAAVVMAMVVILVGVAFRVDAILVTQEMIMAQLDDILSSLDTLGTDIDAAQAHATEVEQELIAAQKQIDDNKAPDLSMVVAKVQALRSKLEGAASTVSTATGGDTSSGTAPTDTLPGTTGDQGGAASTDTGAAGGQTDGATVGDQADATVSSQPAGGGTSDTPSAGTDTSTAAAGDVQGSTTSDPAPQGSPDILSATGLTEGIASNPANPTPGTAPSEQPQQDQAASGEAEQVSDPEAQARDPNQG